MTRAYRKETPGERKVQGLPEGGKGLDASGALSRERRRREPQGKGNKEAAGIEDYFRLPKVSGGAEGGSMRYLTPHLRNGDPSSQPRSPVKLAETTEEWVVRSKKKAEGRASRPGKPKRSGGLDLLGKGGWGVVGGGGGGGWWGGGGGGVGGGGGGGWGVGGGWVLGVVGGGVFGWGCLVLGARGPSITPTL